VWLSRSGPIIKPNPSFLAQSILPDAGGLWASIETRKQGMRGRKADSIWETGKENSCQIHYPGLVGLQFNGKQGQTCGYELQ
jgi:hypothetical protein